MYLSSQAIHDVIHPTAIFSTPATPNDGDSRNTEPNDSTCPLWADSQLNPKNRFDGLDPPSSPLWKIDGCAGLGTHFYAVPLCLGDIPPVHFNVYVPESAVESPRIQRLLDIDTAFHARDHDRVQRQGICSYILRALQAWTVRLGRANVKQLYYNLPFGSNIVFIDLPLRVEDVTIRIVSHSFLERRYKTVGELAQMWQEVHSIPPAMDIYDLVFVRQLHDSVCVVRCQKECGDPTKAGLWALKALTSSVKYMYHELRVLLAMPAHPNVVSTPTRLVTRRSILTPKRENVVGFLTFFYPGGGLRDELPLLRLNNLLRVEDQVRWAMDICAGLLHVRNQAQSYYPDLRLDQIVFPAHREHPVIVDFEQRGVWCEFAAPEINAIEYLMTLASYEEEPDYDWAPQQSDAAESSFGLGLDGCGLSALRFRDIVHRLHPDTKRLRDTEGPYDNPSSGYNVAWLCLDRKEQEYAEVYMLGRLLWCLFEAMSSPQRGAVWQSYRNEPEFDFPEYRRTPRTLRRLIEQCTQGRRDQLSNHVVRQGSKIVLRDDGRGCGTPEEIKAAAKQFWTAEIHWAEGFVLGRERAKADGTWQDNHFHRPTLGDVYAQLKAFHEKMQRERGA